MRIALLLLVLTTIFAVPLSAQNFIIGQSFSGGYSPDGELIDIDGDGDLDYVRVMIYATYSHPLNGFETWENDGTGNFTFITSYDDIPCASLSSGDIDNDGDLDLLVVKDALYNTGPVKIWFNNGNGTFNYSGQTIGSTSTGRVDLSDLDGDGDLDAFLAVINDNPAYSINKVWFNDGSGFFTDSGQLLGNAETYSVSPLDVDNDGDIDMLSLNCCSASNNANVFWLNDGSGQFTNSGLNMGNEQNFEAVFGDMDGDGDQDLVMSLYWYESKQYLNDGMGNFIFDQTITNSSGSLRIGDYNLDGSLDLFVGGWSDNKLKINDGSGNYVTGFVFLANSVMDMVQGDVDNDGDLDFVSATSNNEDNKVWLNQYNTIEVQDISICQSDSIFVNGVWQNSSGLYSETFTNMYGGESVVTVNLMVQNQIEATITASIDTLWCEQSNVTYQWIECENDMPLNDAVQPNFTPSSSGEYAVYISDGVCHDTSVCIHLSIYDCEILINQLGDSIQANILIKDDSLIVDQFEISYQWINCDNNSPLPGENESDFTPSTSGSYAIFISSEVCSDSSECIPITITECNDFLSMETSRIYPNPVNGGLVNVESNHCGDLSLKVFNLNGQLIYEEDIIDSPNHQFELILAKGVYSIVIYSDVKLVQHKLVVL